MKETRFLPRLINPLDLSTCSRAVGGRLQSADSHRLTRYQLRRDPIDAFAHFGVTVPSEISVADTHNSIISDYLPR